MGTGQVFGVAAQFAHMRAADRAAVDQRGDARVRALSNSRTKPAIEQFALGLPKSERAHLVHLLLDSLDSPSETDIQDVWLSEAQRRAGEIDAGKVNLFSSDQLEQQVQALLK